MPQTTKAELLIEATRPSLHPELASTPKWQLTKVLEKKVHRTGVLVPGLQTALANTLKWRWTNRMLP